MASIAEIMQLCRLCLVKEQVNVPIFEEQDDVRQIFVKIAACLPVKVSKEDNLPKKICDGCLYKLELLYQFSNTTTNAEKQLLSWLNEAGLDTDKNSTNKTDDPIPVVSKITTNSKTEPNNVAQDSLSLEAKSYILQQQQLPYESDEFPFQDDDFEEQPPADAPAVSNTEDVEQPPPKRRRTAAPTLLQEPPDESDEDADYVPIEEPAKTDEGSEDEAMVESSLIEVLNEEEQPGPSGIGKAEAQYEEVIVETELESSLMASYQCEVCSQIFADRKEFLEHHMSQFGSTFSCCRCDESFKNSTELYQHYESHKSENEIIISGTNSDINEEIIKEEDEEDVDVLHYSEHVEAVMNIPGSNAIESTNELLYILDDAQCVNEVVIDEAGQVTKPSQSANIKSENFTIVQVDHGYIIPSVFKGQLEPKRRYKKRESTEMFVEDEDTKATNTLVKMEPSTSKNSTYTPPKLKMQPQKRRHEVPDFSATTYQLLNPTEEVDMPHYKCLRCEQLFINKFVFFRHIEKGKCYVNSCDVCTAVFDKNSDFYEHYVAEHTERAICNFCFRTFMYEKNVKEHMLRHLDQFRHRCEECNKGFYTVREYRNHYKNRHMGIRHKCDECGRSFADEYYFKRHLATHGFKNNPTQIQQ